MLGSSFANLLFVKRNRHQTRDRDKKLAPAFVVLRPVPLAIGDVSGEDLLFRLDQSRDEQSVLKIRRDSAKRSPELRRIESLPGRDSRQRTEQKRRFDCWG